MSSVFAVLLVFEADAVEAEDLTELVFVELALSEGLAPVRFNDKWGFIDKTGKEVIPFRYDYALDFSAEGIAHVKFEGMWFYINKKGECVTNCHNAPADYPRMSGEREIPN